LDRIVVEAPASSANIGPGFDVLAIALEKPMDRLEVELESGRRAGVEVESRGSIRVGGSASQNAAGAVALSIAREKGLEGRMVLTLTKGVPVGVGLGSSGASSAAAAVALDRLFGLKLSLEEMVRHAGEGERASSGTAHLDNVTASLLGGFVIVRAGGTPLRFNPPGSLAVVVATPKVSLPRRKTEYARSLVPKRVSIGAMVRNVSMASTIVWGFARGDIGIIGQGMEDAVVEVARAKMIPGFASVKGAAREAGAAGVCISGAGPSMLAFVDEKKSRAGEVLRAMVDEFESGGVRASAYVTRIGEGARVIESS
jgi:homoserine kinase